MRKELYTIITHLPFFGILYKLKTKPMFCSMGLSDGAYDHVLELIQEYQRRHPMEQITIQLIKKLIQEDNKNKEG